MSTNNHRRFHESNIALAGLCQAAALVKQIARSNEYDSQALTTSLNSIAITTSDNTEQVFGDVNHLALGYQTILSQLSNQSTNKDVEVTRYIANLLSIERKLSSSKKTMALLGERISNIQRQQLHLDISDSQMLSNLASIYTDVVSPVARKIQVAGDPEKLKRPDNQHRVRAILLAGVRAAVLWRQLGGKRRHILFSRQQILDSAQQTLNNISTPN
ncbi:high frequency lysogenization protein HflD [Paraglaciecola sp. MB-3u-78]|jgi:high frequency lysogenization protein|uniref:high frequency lysogenization protein HflD n=1 Tax=Paraglaciecola sp. MB-3u-78 TaxID=2058332 RepID=UPI000C335FBB|nr:high frequency lysogenization protein HflD [Paraglaciecola sp. MB-3u-78]PKG97558.1 lysogenization regulator HflD [Paraglaciecola sp. MB-3u-78]